MGYVVCVGEKRNVYRILVGNHEGKRPLGRYGHRYHDTIKVDDEYVQRVWPGLIWLRTGICG